MNKNETYYPDLIARYLSGEASTEEISDLSEWIRSNPEHASLYDELRKTWLKVSADQVEQEMDLDREWKEIVPKLSGMHQEKSVRKRPEPVKKQEPGKRFKLKLTRKPKQSPRSEPESLYKKDPVQQPSPLHHGTTAPLHHGTTAPLHHGTTAPRHHLTNSPQVHPVQDAEPKVVKLEPSSPSIKIMLIRASLIAAIAIILLIPIWITYQYFTRTEVIRLAATNEVLDAFLPDGSMVSLNAYSSLTYTEEFGKANRNIELSGEGYFEVTRDSLIPFVISSGNSRLEVLGTSFYVNSEQVAGNMEVVLIDGRVTVYFENERSTGKSIIPGEKAKLTPSNQRIVVTSNEDPNFLAWKTHQLIFIDERLDKIITTLNKVYQCDITLANENLAPCRLTATFNQQPLESVLNVILVTLDLHAENTQPGIILYGYGCN